MSRYVYFVSFALRESNGLLSDDLLTYKTTAEGPAAAVAAAMQAIDDLGVRIDRLTYYSVVEGEAVTR